MTAVEGRGTPTTIVTIIVTITANVKNTSLTFLSNLQSNDMLIAANQVFRGIQEGPTLWRAHTHALTPGGVCCRLWGVMGPSSLSASTWTQAHTGHCCIRTVHSTQRPSLTSLKITVIQRAPCQVTGIPPVLLGN